MTPFGVRVRELRAARGVTLTRMAEELGLSAAYLSALEHGRRSRPAAGLVRQICAYFGIIWDDADELMRLAQNSRPRVTVATGGLSPRATELANLLAVRIRDLPDETLETLIGEIERAPKRQRRS